MIRITVLSQSSEEVVLKVEGQLEGPDVELLEEEGTRWRQQTRQLVLNVRGLQYSDQNGVQLLKRWIAEGVLLKEGVVPYILVMKTHGLVVEPAEE